MCDGGRREEDGPGAAVQEPFCARLEIQPPGEGEGKCCARGHVAPPHAAPCCGRLLSRGAPVPPGAEEAVTAG